MQYIIKCVQKNNNFNASSKARNDVENIAQMNEIKEIKINIKNLNIKIPIFKFLKIFCMFYNYFKFKRKISNLKKEDIIYIQYPMYSILNLNKILKDISKKGIKTCLVIHDLDSLRYYDKKINRFKYEDKQCLKNCDFIISHNERMTNKILDWGINKDKIINLKIFDYLDDSNNIAKSVNKKLPIIIAGNLSSIKSGYIEKINDLNIPFNLYGSGINENVLKQENINYKGSFQPEKLVHELEGSFGLVWDGSSIYECTGNTGNYLKYNNPHKVSLYLSAQIPVIVWKEAAIADFVLKNKVGIAVSNLEEIKEILEKLKDKEYDEMVKNTKIISKKLKNGEYLKEVLKKIGENSSEKI